MKMIELDEGVLVVQSDRFGGVSKGAFKSLNLGFHVGDEPRLVEENRRIFASYFGVNPQKLCFMDQIHSDKIALVKTNDRVEADAIITQKSDLVLCVMVADCAPVVLFAPEVKAVAAIHAGRKGAFLNIISKTIEAFAREFGASEKIKAFIGASIKSCCYEIKGEVLLEARENFGFALKNRDGKAFLDLRKILRAQLKSCGVTEILEDDRCTCCEGEFFSYRRDGVCGRFGVGIKLR